MSDISQDDQRKPAGLRLPGNRQTLLLASLVLFGGGAALNLDWLTAIGAAPLILSLAPCAAMCALGLCMRGGSSACAKSKYPATTPDAQID